MTILSEAARELADAAEQYVWHHTNEAFRRLNNARLAYREAEKLVRDAERYRWLRVHSWVDTASAQPTIEYGNGFNQTAPEVLDNELDAAIAQQEPKT